jgi:C4-dicarboxylate transporter DctQ subunit
MSALKLIINNIERTICVVFMIVDLILLSIQVIGRYVFNSSPAWTEELARYFFIWIIFIGAGYTAQNVGHIAMDAINKLYPKAVRNYAYVAGLLAIIAGSLYIAVISFDYTMGLFAQNRVSMTTGIQMGFVYLAIPLGMLSVAIRTLQSQLLPFFFPSWRHSEENLEDKLDEGRVY